MRFHALNTRYFIIKVGLADSDKGKFNLFITRENPIGRIETGGAISYEKDCVAHPLSGRVRVRNDTAVDLTLS